MKYLNNFHINHDNYSFPNRSPSPPSVSPGGSPSQTATGMNIINNALSSSEEKKKSRSTGIYVAIRCRPFVPREIKNNENRCMNMFPDEVQINDPKNGDILGFGLDEHMDSSVDSGHEQYYDQARVYQAIGLRVLDEVKQGFNAALFCYGQTGSGKTTSMMGDMEPAENRGILPRLLVDLFQHLEVKKAEGWRVDCRARFMEIYNEKIQDLLLTNINQRKKLDVRMHPKLGVYVPDLTINAVETMEDTMSLIEYSIFLNYEDGAQ